MADNLIEILIKFGLDKSKAEEASRELRRLGETSAAAGKAGVKAATEHAEATEKSTKKIEGMNKAMNLLESKLGEFGQLAKFVMSPETLGVAALAVGLDQIFGHFQKIKEEAEAAGMKLQAMDQAKLEGLQKALQTSRESAAGLTRELAGAGHVMDTLKEGFDRQSAARTAMGLPTDPAAELQARATAQPGLNAAAEAATAAVAALDKDPKFIEAAAQLAAGQNTTATLRAKLVAAGVAKPGDLEGLGKLAAADTQPEGGYIARQYAQAMIAQQQLDAHLASMSGYQSVVDQQGLARKAAEQEATYRTGAATSNATRFEELARSQRIGESGSLGARGAAAFSEAEGIASRFSAGGKISGPESELLRSVASVGGGRSVGTDMASKILSEVSKNEQARNAFLERILAALEASGGINAGFDRRLTMLENRIKSESRNP